MRRRSGPQREAELHLHYDHFTLTATCHNPVRAPGPHARPTAAHRGLEGIRSRAAMFNGSAVYGPTPDGTAWRTTVSFPLDHPDTADHVGPSDGTGRLDRPAGMNTPEKLERP